MSSLLEEGEKEEISGWILVSLTEINGRRVEKNKCVVSNMLNWKGLPVNLGIAST